jgi:hypothetical protein
MKSLKAAGLVVSLGLLALGCDNGGSRTLHGQISTADYSLTQPVMLIESASHLSYVANISSTGQFRIRVPAGQSYRVTLANRTSTGSLALVSRVLWSGHGQNFVWAKVGTGSTIEFGLVRPLNAGAATAVGGLSTQTTGADDQGQDNDDQCDDDDNSQGDEQGQADSGSTCTPPLSPPSNPSLCMPGAMGDSKGDHDDDGADQDNDSQGDDDRDGKGSSMVCGDGGVMMSGGDNNQGDDNAQGNEDEDDDSQGGHHCVKHVPPCPPPGMPGSGTGSGTMPPAVPDMAVGTGSL